MEAEDPDAKPVVAKRARRSLSGERHDFTSKETVHLPHNNGTGGGGDRAEENLQAPVASMRAYAGSGGTEYGMFELSFCRPGGLLLGGDISLLHQCTHLLGPEGVSSTPQHLPFNVVRQGGLIPNAGYPFTIAPYQGMSATSTMTAFPAMTAPSALTNLNNSFDRYLEGQQSGSQVFGARELAPQVLLTLVNGGSHRASLKDHKAATLPITAGATHPNGVQEGLRQTPPKVDRTLVAAFALEAFPVSIEEDDDEGISEYQSTLRKQMEFFEASSVDIAARAQGRNVPIRLKQVGIRCIHCKNIPAGHRPRGAVYFPQKLESLYQAAQNMSTNHFHIGVCKSSPESTLLKLSELKRNKRSGGNGGCCKRCWVESAKKLGIVDAPVTGLEYRKPKAQHPRQG